MFTVVPCQFPFSSRFPPLLQSSERPFRYYVFMPSSRNKKRQSGSAQVGKWRFTYEDRIHSFEELESEQGISALSAYAELYGCLERKLFGRYCAGVSLPSLKSSYLLAHRIPARMFNGLRVSLEGKYRRSVRVNSGRLRVWTGASAVPRNRFPTR